VKKFSVDARRGGAKRRKRGGTGPDYIAKGKLLVFAWRS